MTYVFEKLQQNEDNPREIDAVFISNKKDDWSVSRYVMPMAKLFEPGELFKKMNVEPDGRDKAMAATIDLLRIGREWELRAQCPSVLDGRTQKDIPSDAATVRFSTGERLAMPSNKVA